MNHLASGAPTTPASTAAAPEVAACRHCGLPLPAAVRDGPFCCTGCRAAFETIAGLGLDGYYRRRTLDPGARPLKPDEDAPAIDASSYVRDAEDGTSGLSLMIDGLHCAACVWLIESVLARQPGVVEARVNMTTRRLALAWRTEVTSADTLAAAVTALGYRLVPFDPEALDQAGRRQEQILLRAMAVAGFAAGNVMLLSVPVWAGHIEGMGPATRTLFHWISALIALPAIAYAGRPFFRSALAVLRRGRTNMDVPISIGVVLAAGISLHETAAGGDHAYFDSAITLLFFLLVGRYLDRRARGRARSAAEHLLALGGRAVTVVGADGTLELVAPTRVLPGMRVFVAAGERIGVDGEVTEGRSALDTSLIDGESVPTAAAPGSRVFAGTLNLSAPLTLSVTAVGADTLLAEMARLVEAAEQGRDRYVALADRAARLYAPLVHGLAAATFLGWWLMVTVPWQDALLTAISVLIITCPCALALAVPAVQVIATGRLLHKGILIKTPTALERLAGVDTIVFDKTGTLTMGRPQLVADDGIDDGVLEEAAALAASSRHPLARALVAAAAGRGLAAAPLRDSREVPGCGIERDGPDGRVRLGSRRFCGVGDDGTTAGAELWLLRPHRSPVRFAFTDPLRPDAETVVASLRARGFHLAILSGDRPATVTAVAARLQIADARAGLSPADKYRRLEALRERGHRVLMVGDGLNDAPALAAATVSMSPSTGIDLSVTTADLVFQGVRLAPVAEAVAVARRAGRLVKQNFALAVLYNVITIPLAILGHVTPLVAAAAMSASSIVVIVNALRLGRGDAR